MFNPELRADVHQLWMENNENESFDRSRREERIMLRLVAVVCICLTTFPVFCQSTSKYQVGTIIGVKTHPTDANSDFDAVSYDVSVKVGDTVYVVLYTPPLGEETVKYSAGRDLLVLVGKRTIRYNDILGQSFEVPIESQKPAAMPKQSKSVSHAAE
jgi:hypothetical protein